MAPNIVSDANHNSKLTISIKSCYMRRFLKSKSDVKFEGIGRFCPKKTDKKIWRNSQRF